MLSLAQVIFHGNAGTYIISLLEEPMVKASKLYDKQTLAEVINLI